MIEDCILSSLLPRVAWPEDELIRTTLCFQILSPAQRGTGDSLDWNQDREKDVRNDSARHSRVDNGRMVSDI